MDKSIKIQLWNIKRAIQDLILGLAQNGQPYLARSKNDVNLKP
jgi:hypothetical protein